MTFPTPLTSKFKPYHFLRSGIPSFDALLYGYTKGNTPSDTMGIQLVSDAPQFLDPTSLCISGPDGTGKSVFAMHFAAHYAADCAKEGCFPRIIYISTDLKYARAEKVWHNFMLNDPLNREVPFTDVEAKRLPVDLKGYIPGDKPKNRQEPVTNYLMLPVPTEGTKPVVAFIDLATETAGDDWDYINRILGSIEEPQDNQPKHLIILDAAEGLETLVGEYDGHGEKRSRRSRVAQFVRAAMQKFHILLITEEAAEDARLPEQYVTDFVVRLRNVQVRNSGNSYTRRTLEIEKSRGQSAIRGQHTFTIRNGAGSTTGTQPNPDDPQLLHPDDKNRAIFALFYVLTYRKESGHRYFPTSFFPMSKGTEKRFVSYVQVMHSLDYVNRRIMMQPGENIQGPSKTHFAGFGIEHLDNMLDSNEQVDKTLDSNEQVDKISYKDQVSLKELLNHIPPETTFSLLSTRDKRLLRHHSKGVPSSSITALIGEYGTHKIRLATAFLSQCFLPDEDQFAVLITTADIDSVGLAERIFRHLEPGADIPEGDRIAEIERIKRNILCRRLEKHDIAGATLFQIVKEAVWQARKTLNATTRSTSTKDRHIQGKQIRLVLFNLADMANTYPDVRDNPLFLPTLNFYLQREGITTLIVHTEEGGPANPDVSVLTDRLRSEVSQHIYTWRVPFYGQERIAISVVPAITDRHPSQVRELKSKENKDGLVDDDALEVDPHFEMYSGLIEKQDPKIIPLRVRLWGSAKRFDSYQAQVNTLFQELFPDVKALGDIVSATPKEEYENLISFINLQGKTRLSNTVVVQIDEFWDPYNQSFMRMKDYMRAETVGNLANDPYRLFQKTKGGSDRRRRKDFFEDTANNEKLTYRVPYTWDFGFLLLRKFMWEAAFHRKFKIRYSSGSKEVEQLASSENLLPLQDDVVAATGSEKLASTQDEGKAADDKRDLMSVKEVWDKLSGPHVGPTDVNAKRTVTWREFLHACTVVSRAQGSDANGYPVPFDIDMTAPESFACLVLEVWASEIKKRKPDDAAKLFARMRLPARDDADKALAEERDLTRLLVNYRIEFYRAWLLLGEVFSPDLFGADGLYYGARPSLRNAVASRHWYSTGMEAQEECPAEERLIPMRLPGHYSARGDWFLTIEGGSRSQHLGERAIDLLSSRRANMLRLQEGIGLPTRLFVEPEDDDRIWTRLYHERHHDNIWPIVGKEASTTDKDAPANTNLFDKPKWVPVEYQNLKFHLGETTFFEQSRDEPFSWIWRSSLGAYRRQYRVFLKMVFRILYDWRENIETVGTEWRNGFDAYDHYAEYNHFEDVEGREPLVGGKWFGEELDRWIKALQTSTPDE